MGLWHDFEMVVGFGRSTLGSGNRKKLERFPSTRQFYFSIMSSPGQFQLESGYQVLPPRRRWDLCAGML